MRGFALHLLWGLLTPHFFRSWVSCMQLTVASDPSSRVGGYYPLTVAITTACDYPENPSFVLSQLWLSSSAEDCSDLIQLEGSFMELVDCSSKEGVVKVSVNSGEIKTGAEIRVRIEGVRYNSEKYPSTLAVEAFKDSTKIEGAVNEEDWVPQELAKLQKFSLSPTASVVTCQSFGLALSGNPVVSMPQGSFIVINFDSDIDLSNSNSPDLDNFQRTTRSVSGATRKEHSASDKLTITLEALKAPPIAKDLYVTMKTLTALHREVHEETRKLYITPESLAHSGVVELVESAGVCERGKYRVEVAPRCLPIPNARYKIISPSSVFGVQQVTVSSQETLEKSTLVDFELTNPCSRIPGFVLSGEAFGITVYDGDQNETAFTAEAKLLSSTSYEFGKLVNFKVEPEYRGYGYECSYTFSMMNYNSIPQYGKIVLTLSPSIEVKPGLTATINGAETMAVHSNGEITVMVPAYISSFKNILIVVGDLKNPYEANVYSGFSATSFSDMNYGIDKSADASVAIDEPGVATVTCSLSNVRNQEMAEYSFIFSSATVSIRSGDIIGVKVPPEIDPTSCSRVDNEPADSIDAGEDIDHWLTVTNLVSSTRVGFKLACRNPAVTATTGKFKILLFRLNGFKLLKGEVSIKTEQGAYLNRQESSLKCDKTCPRCRALCRVTLARKTNVGFSTVVVISSLLNLQELGCKYDESGQSYLSTCTILEGGEGDKIKVTINTRREVSTIEIKDVSIIYPEYSETRTYPISIRTYTTKDIDSESLIEEDEVARLSGDCDYPCKGCSQGHDKCDSCVEDSADGEQYYYYPDHAVGCSVAAATNCRPLEEGKCCGGYYKSETSRQCRRCSSECKQCQGSGDYCTECVDGSLFVVEGKCIDNCGEGFYRDTANTCRPCSSGCKNCSSSTVCTECYSNFNLHQAACTSLCPEGTYAEGSACSPCDENCAACHESALQCTRCRSEGAKFLLASVHKCVESCEGDRVVVDEAKKICALCNPECAECKGTTAFCSKCHPGKFLNETAGLCLSTCVPNGYNKGTVCAHCENYCATCISATECLSCAYGLVLVTTTGECKGFCPRQFYEVDNKCYPCSSRCESCGNASTCFSCVDGYYLAKGQCYRGSCPPGNFNSFGKLCEKCDASCSACKGNRYSCIECAPNYYPSGNQCFLSCPVGTILVDKKCKACDDGCYSCSRSTNFCTSCNDGKYFYKNKCLNTCPKFTAPSPNNICISCLEGCSECDWDGLDTNYPEHCTDCLPGYKHLEGKCYLRCPNTYVSSFDGSSCVIDAANYDVKGKYRWVCPHLIAVAGVSVLVVLLQVNKKRALVVPSLIIVVNYIGISLYTLIIVTALPELIIKVIVTTGVIMALQLVLNLSFALVFRRQAKDDPGFKAWANSNSGLDWAIAALSCLFSFQTHRLLYSRPMDSARLLVSFANLDRLFCPLNLFSALQLTLVQGPVIVFGLVEFYCSSDITANGELITEAFILSFLLALLLLYETLNAEAILKSFEEEEKLKALRSSSARKLAAMQRASIKERKSQEGRRYEEEIKNAQLGGPSREERKKSPFNPFAEEFKQGRMISSDNAHSDPSEATDSKIESILRPDLRIVDNNASMILPSTMRNYREDGEDFDEEMDEKVSAGDVVSGELQSSPEKPLQSERQEEVTEEKKTQGRVRRSRRQRRNLVEKSKEMPLEGIPEANERDEESQYNAPTFRAYDILSYVQP